MLDYSELAAIRLGYGMSPNIPSPGNPEELADSVRNSGPIPSDLKMDEVRNLQAELREIRASGAPDAAEQVRKRRQVGVRRKFESIQHRIGRAVGDPGGFGERLVQFWADHFTVRGGDALESMMAEAFVTEAIRPFVMGRFADMMFWAETHPRMLNYLNQTGSIGPNSRVAKENPQRHVGINENLAREMIELHSLGVGAAYTQDDVRELAKLLTGLGYDPRTPHIFRPVKSEPGAETVLGRSYGGDGRASLDDIRAVITDLARHPATASHVARKLAIHFVSDDPPQTLVDRLAGVFLATDGDLPTLNLTLAKAPELEGTFRQKVRQPLDFMISALRAVGFDRDAIMALPPAKVRAQLGGGLSAMGQAWGLPRGPDGWPEEADAWATPQGIAARIDWVTRQLPKLDRELPDPRDVLTASLGATSSEPLRWAVPKAESAREGLAVVLASADFNRR